MVQVVLEVFHRAHLWQNLLDDVLVVAQDFIECIWLETVASLQINKLSERETSQVVTFHDSIEFWILFLQSHHTGTCEHDFQLWVEVVALAQLLAPVRLLEDLVDEKGSAAMADKVACKVCDSSALEIEIVHIHIQALAVSRAKVLFGILEKECRLAYTACSLNANHTVAPVYFVHQGASYWCVRMLYEVCMCSEECFFHEFNIVSKLFLRCKGN